MIALPMFIGIFTNEDGLDQIVETQEQARIEALDLRALTGCNVYTLEAIEQELYDINDLIHEGRSFKWAVNNVD